MNQSEGPVFSEEACKLFEYFLQKIDIPQDGWTPIHSVKGVEVYQRWEKDCAFSVLKGVGIVQASPEKVLEAVTDPLARPQWDRFYEGGHLVRWVHQNDEAIVYMKTKTYSYIVWPRDSCLRVAQKKLSFSSSEDSNKGEMTGYLAVGRSIEDPDCPPTNGHVRGIVLLSGFHICPIAPGFVRLTYLYQVDAQGWLPTSLVDIVNKYQPLSILGIRRYLTGSSQEVLPSSSAPSKNHQTPSD